MNQLKNVICSRCGTIFPEREIDGDQWGQKWYCDYCGKHTRITEPTKRQPVQRTTWLKDGEGRWAIWNPDTGEVIEDRKSTRLNSSH